MSAMKLHFNIKIEHILSIVALIALLISTVHTATADSFDKNLKLLKNATINNEHLMERLEEISGEEGFVAIKVHEEDNIYLIECMIKCDDKQNFTYMNVNFYITKLTLKVFEVTSKVSIEPISKKNWLTRASSEGYRLLNSTL